MAIFPLPFTSAWCLPFCLLPPSMFSFIPSSLLPPLSFKMGSPVSQAGLQLVPRMTLNPWSLCLHLSSAGSQVWATMLGTFLVFLEFLWDYILFRKPNHLELAERIHLSRKGSDIHIKHSQDPLGIWGKNVQGSSLQRKLMWLGWCLG